MKIALIEFEYPPDTAMGGIAAYTSEAARGLTNRGHHVEVFAGAKDRVGRFESNGILVHRIGCDAQEFFLHAGRAFAERHAEMAFDVLEGAELTAPAREAIRLVPDMALVVRLHGPSFKLRTMSVPSMKLSARVRTVAGAMLRGQRPFWWDQPIDRIERAHAIEADVIAATSRAVGELTQLRWGLDPQKLVVSPLPITPHPALLALAPGGAAGMVTFIGHVGIGKGLVDLLAAMEIVLRKNTAIRFRLVGHIGPSPDAGKDMRQFILGRLGGLGSRVEIGGAIPRSEMPVVYRQTDILVLPSHWDTFPVVCLEAMSAARAIIGTTCGGIPEMLDDGNVGVLVPAFRPSLLGRAILELMDDAKRREELGAKARQRLLTVFDARKSMDIQEKCYAMAVTLRKEKGTRRTPENAGKEA